MKGRKVALLGIAALGVASVSQGKVIVLDASPNTDTIASGVFVAFDPRTEHQDRNYVQSAYLERPYGILSPPAVANANYEPAEARSRLKSFRELSKDRTPEQVSGSSIQGSFASTVSEDDGETGMTDAGVTLLMLCGLAAFQLRRKQQLLKHLPLFR